MQIGVRGKKLKNKYVYKNLYLILNGHQEQTKTSDHLAILAQRDVGSYFPENWFVSKR